MINFPFGTKGKLFFLGVQILKHITADQGCQNFDATAIEHFTVQVEN